VLRIFGQIWIFAVLQQWLLQQR